MTNYYIEKENKIVLFDTNKQKLENTLKFTPQYSGLEIKETERPIINFEFADDPAYINREFINAVKIKYAEITNNYDYANKYLVLLVDEENQLYANVSWYQTWTKVISLASMSPVSEEPLVVPNAVRFYKRTPENKLYNLNIENLKVDKLLEYYNIIQYAQFNILQPIRNNFYDSLNKATSIAEINNIIVDYGLTLNEQDIEDVNQKIDLQYVEQKGD